MDGKVLCFVLFALMFGSAWSVPLRPNKRKFKSDIGGDHLQKSDTGGEIGRRFDGDGVRSRKLVDAGVARDTQVFEGKQGRISQRQIPRGAPSRDSDGNEHHAPVQNKSHGAVQSRMHDAENEARDVPRAVGGLPRRNGGGLSQVGGSRAGVQKAKQPIDISDRHNDLAADDTNRHSQNNIQPIETDHTNQDILQSRTEEPFPHARAVVMEHDDNRNMPKHNGFAEHPAPDEFGVHTVAQPAPWNHHDVEGRAGDSKQLYHVPRPWQEQPNDHQEVAGFRRGHFQQEDFANRNVDRPAFIDAPRHDDDLPMQNDEEKMRLLLKEITELRQKMQKDDGTTMMPPDHVVGMPLERDGDTNRAMHREALFGKELRELGGLSRSNLVQRLRRILEKADSNGDQELDSTELGEWIHEQGLEHSYHAKSQNQKDFAHVDKDRDGELTWSEYVRHIQHMRPSDVHRHAPKRLSKAIWRDLQRLKNGNLVAISNHDQVVSENSTLQRLLLRDLQRWRNADTDSDMKLSEHEFFTFRHPEYNRLTLAKFVNELIGELDQNGDNRLTLDEYMAVKPNPNDRDEELDADVQAIVQERHHQFTELIDLDGDGVATPEELEQFVDPLSAQSSINSALSLIRKVDDDKDSRVSWDEMMAHRNLFEDSHANPVLRKTHNEL